jgi:RNA methyltransferase, TrmH family
MPVQELIKSKDNPRIKELKKLSQKKYRKEYGQFLVENKTIILDALSSGHIFNTLFVSPDFIQKNQTDFDKIKNYPKIGEIIYIDQPLNKYFSQMDTAPGIAAIFNINESPLDQSLPVVYLNGLNDPGNVGTIIRTMAAFGFKNLIVDENCADIYNSKTISAAKDSIFRINILRDQKFDWLKKNRQALPIYASHVRAGESVDNFKPAKKYCLVLGSESHGVDEDIMELASLKINIPSANKIESLNVSAAAAIILHKLAINFS